MWARPRARRRVRPSRPARVTERTFVLFGGGIRAEVDPCGGADVLSVRVADGREVLFHPHWEVEPSDRGRDDQSWVRGWRGGWTLLYPNAGPACIHQGRRHPYHGDAALSEWEVVDSASDGLNLRYVDVDGAIVERDHRIRRDSLTIVTTIANPTSQPVEFMAVEHLILASALVWEGAPVDLPAGPRRILDAESAPGDWSRIPGPGTQRFGTVLDCGPRRAAASGRNGVRVSVSWTGDHLTSLWYWLENGWNPESPWDRRTRCLGLEPATSANSDGLAEASKRGMATTLGPGSSMRHSTTLTVEHERPLPPPE